MPVAMLKITMNSPAKQHDDPEDDAYRQDSPDNTCHEIHLKRAFLCRRDDANRKAPCSGSSIDSNDPGESPGSCGFMYWRPSGNDRRGTQLAGEGEVAIAHVDNHLFAFVDLPVEQPDRQGIEHMTLDHALERPTAKHRVVPKCGEHGPSSLGHKQRDVTLGKTLLDRLQLQLDDVANLLARERTGR